ncbi:unnamed protein product [Phyllotreta striolata]|uniref:Uncharacterized protein n=1 Tax=Phyllotreta striolata TaxID=444603 RepID=A0A9N9TXQ8_PHYSR|nr:unnamed protein product [Phyllotreta striolata]
MLKLVVLFAVVAVAVAKPSGWLHSAPVVQSYSLPVVAVPSAVSHSYRKDVISKPVIAAYSAPAIVAAPVVHKIVPAAVSYSHRSDVISKPVVAAYSAPVWAYSAHVPAVHAW